MAKKKLTRVQLNAEFKKLIAKDRKIEEKRHKASLKSLMQRAKLNRVSTLGF